MAQNPQDDEEKQNSQRQTFVLRVLPPASSARPSQSVVTFSLRVTNRNSVGQKPRIILASQQHTNVLNNPVPDLSEMAQMAESASALIVKARSNIASSRERVEEVRQKMEERYVAPIEKTYQEAMQNLTALNQDFHLRCQCPAPPAIRPTTIPDPGSSFASSPIPSGRDRPTSVLFHSEIQPVKALLNLYTSQSFDALIVELKEETEQLEREVEEMPVRIIERAMMFQTKLKESYAQHLDRIGKCTCGAGACHRGQGSERVTATVTETASPAPVVEQDQEPDDQAPKTEPPPTASSSSLKSRFKAAFRMRRLTR